MGETKPAELNKAQFETRTSTGKNHGFSHIVIRLGFDISDSYAGFFIQFVIKSLYYDNKDIIYRDISFGAFSCRVCAGNRGFFRVGDRPGPG
jgi:hypothetical protein